MYKKKSNVAYGFVKSSKGGLVANVRAAGKSKGLFRPKRSR